jgi:hypothetical protein
MCLFIGTDCRGRPAGPAEGNPDLYVLNCPWRRGARTSALLGVSRGFSRRRPWWIVGAIAVSTWCRTISSCRSRFASCTTGGCRAAMSAISSLTARPQSSIGAVASAMGFVYFQVSGGGRSPRSADRLSPVSARSFCRACSAGSRRGRPGCGALAGLHRSVRLSGPYTLFSELRRAVLLGPNVLAQGPCGSLCCAPRRCSASTARSLVHAVVWSVGPSADLHHVSVSPADAAEEIQRRAIRRHLRGRAGGS